MPDVWPFPPQTEMTERMEWVTEVIRCRSAEQRLCLRKVPRTVLTFNYQFLPQEIEAATSLARDFGADEFLLPFWQETTRVGTVDPGTSAIQLDTTKRRYEVGGTAFLIGTNGVFKVLTISEVNPDSLVFEDPFVDIEVPGAAIMPCFPARFQAPFKIRKLPAHYLVADAEFIVTHDFGITESNPFPEYLDSYVMTDRPLVSGSSEESQLREYASFSNLAGPLYYSKTYTYPISTSIAMWSFDSVSDAWGFRQWMYITKGRQGSFYAPRWVRDFLPAQNIFSSNSFIIVSENKYREDTYIGPVCVVLNNGTMVYCLVIGWEIHSLGLRKMLLSAPIGVSITVADIEMITRMPVSRFNSDNIEFSFSTGKVDVRIPLMEVPA